MVGLAAERPSHLSRRRADVRSTRVSVRTCLTSSGLCRADWRGYLFDQRRPGRVRHNPGLGIRQCHRRGETPVHGLRRAGRKRVVSASSRRVRQEEMNPVDTPSPSGRTSGPRCVRSRARPGWPTPPPWRSRSGRSRSVHPAPPPGGGVSAAAAAAHHPILGHRHREGRRVEHLHPGRDRSRRTGQVATAAFTTGRLDRLPAVGCGHRGQAAATMPRLPTLGAPGPVRRTRRRLPVE